MSNEENYIIENETADSSKKQEYWDTGIGLNKVEVEEGISIDNDKRFSELK